MVMTDKPKGRPPLPAGSKRVKCSYTLSRGAIEALAAIQRAGEPRSLAVERIILEAAERGKAGRP